MWSTPERQAYLVRLCAQAREFYEEDGRVVPDNNEAIELAIYIWKAVDREEREEAWRREKRRLHALPEILKRGPFDSIAREEYLSSRPL